MASFYAYDFVYDGIPSHTYDLKIINFDSGGLFEGTGSSDIEILSQRVMRKAKPYYLGRIQQPVLEFELTFGRAATVTALDRDLISAWLFGRSNYKKLEILQDDLNASYFKCFFTKPKPVYIGGLNYAFKTTIVCDSPFAYLPAKTVKLLDNESSKTIDIYNYSSEDEYLYPESLVIENPDVFQIMDGSISIYNETDRTPADTARETFISGIKRAEIITINNDLQIAETTEATHNVLTSFNKNWFRLLPKNNEIYTTAPFPMTVTLTYTERMKIGG